MSQSAISTALTPPPCRETPPNCAIFSKRKSTFSGFSPTMRLFSTMAYCGPAMSRTSPKSYTSWFVSIRIITQGLGPGLTTTAYRMSVILRVDGLELRLTFLIAPSALAFLNACGRRPPAHSIAEDLSMLRRLNFTRSRLNIFSSPFRTIFLHRANNCCWLVAHEATLPPRRRSLRRHTAVFRTDFYSSRTYAHRKFRFNDFIEQRVVSITDL